MDDVYTPATITAIASLVMVAVSFTMGRTRAGWLYLMAALGYYGGIMFNSIFIGLAGFAALSIASWLMFEPLAPKEKSDEGSNPSRRNQRR